jgi:hypothetical protein
MDDDSILQFDWNIVEGRTISAILGKRDIDLGLIEVAICLGDHAVILRVNNDTDEIWAFYEPLPGRNSRRWKPIGEFEREVGKKLAWCWSGRNSQGYLDMFTISLSNIDPMIAFVAVASSLHLKRLTPCS